MVACPRFEPTIRQVSEALGGRSEEISQIRVVWGKAVALSRLEPPNVLDSIALSRVPVFRRREIPQRPQCSSKRERVGMSLDLS